MRWRTLGLSAAATLCLFGGPGASAWDSGNRQMFASPSRMFARHAPRTFAPERFERMAAGPRRAHVAASGHLHRHGPAQGGLAPLILATGGVLPTEMEGPLTEPQAAAEPEVIIIGSRNALQEKTAPETPPDYSYAGCHAIPNGYHCDLPGN